MSDILESGRILVVKSGDAGLLREKCGHLLDKTSEPNKFIVKEGVTIYINDVPPSTYVKNNGSGAESGIIEILSSANSKASNDYEKNNSFMKYDNKNDLGAVPIISNVNSKENNDDKKNNSLQIFDSDRKLFCYYPKNKNMDIMRYKIRNIVRDTSPGDDDDEELDNYRFSNNRKNPLNQMMLGEVFNDFIDDINASKVIKIDKNGNIEGTRAFKDKYLGKIDNCVIRFYETKEKMQSEWAYWPDKEYIKDDERFKEIKLNNGVARARFLNNIDDVLKCIHEGRVKNVSSNLLRKIRQSYQKSVPCCLRYVGYAALCDILPECTRMKYSNVGTTKANETYNKVVAIRKALSLGKIPEAEEGRDKKKKNAFISALDKWIARYELVRNAREEYQHDNDFIEWIQSNNEQANLNLDVNNRSKNKGLFTII